MKVKVVIAASSAATVLVYLLTLLAVSGSYLDFSQNTQAHPGCLDEFTGIEANLLVVILPALVIIGLSIAATWLGTKMVKKPSTRAQVITAVAIAGFLSLVFFGVVGYFGRLLILIGCTVT